MSNAKNVLMLVVMSAGTLTLLTGSGVSQVQPAFADDDEDECNENRDNNCNEETQKVHQEIKCKVDGKIENGDKSDENSMSLSSNGDITCWNFAQNPEDGDAIVDEENSGTQNSGTQNLHTEDLDTQNSGTQNSGTQNSGTQNSGTQNSGTQNSGTQNLHTEDLDTQNSGTQNSGTQNVDGGDARVDDCGDHLLNFLDFHGPYHLHDFVGVQGDCHHRDYIHNSLDLNVPYHVHDFVDVHGDYHHRLHIHNSLD
jgi:hypothetical protein